MNTTVSTLVTPVYLLLMLACVFLVVSCPDDGAELDCSGETFTQGVAPPYNSPVWHPSGDFIGFNYAPRDSMVRVYPCYVESYFNWDSAGFWLVDADGDNMRRVFPYMLYLPAWSPDGNWIAFSSGGCIFKMRFTGNDFDTTSIQQLTFSGDDFSPTWSPDGSSIAYSRNICDGVSPCGLLTMSNDGSNVQHIRLGVSPSWSPDEEWLAYAYIPFEIYKARISSPLDTVRLTFRNPNSADASWESYYPKFSPSGRYVAFVSYRRGDPEDSGVWIAPANGGNLRKVTSHSTLADYPFSWSPNSRKIVYLRYRLYDFSKSNGTLWIVDVNTGVENQLTFNKN